LPSVWEEVRALQALDTHPSRHEQRIERQELIEQDFRWVTNIDYHGHQLQWLECRETLTHTRSGEATRHRFVHLTQLEVTAATVALLSRTGRLRWTIENEGFNTQKHHGYATCDS